MVKMLPLEGNWKVLCMLKMAERGEQLLHRIGAIFQGWVTREGLSEAESPRLRAGQIVFLRQE